MIYRDAARDLKSLVNYINDQWTSVQDISLNLQEKIYNVLLNEIVLFDSENGRFIAGADLRKRILLIEDKINKILGQQNYANTIDSFLNSFETIESRNIRLQKTYNELEVSLTKVRPARLLLYEQAQDALTNAVSDKYVQPVKMLLMQQVTGGASISESLTLLKNWNEGELSSGRLNKGIQTPSLDRYATQVARDTAFSVHRNFQQVVKNEYELKRLIYVGGIKKDSRELCTHLVNLNRPIELKELPPLIAKYPQGLYPNTSHLNFMQVNGGFNCLHISMAVR